MAERVGRFRPSSASAKRQRCSSLGSSSSTSSPPSRSRSPSLLNAQNAALNAKNYPLESLPSYRKEERDSRIAILDSYLSSPTSASSTFRGDRDTNETCLYSPGTSKSASAYDPITAAENVKEISIRGDPKKYSLNGGFLFPEKPEDCIGIVFKREFKGAGVFSGKIIGYNPKKGLLSVEYDDGDIQQSTKIALQRAVTALEKKVEREKSIKLQRENKKKYRRVNKKGKSDKMTKLDRKSESIKLPKGVYIVECIVDKRLHNHFKLGDIVQYKVKWLGYDLSECTWEPVAGLPTEVIQAYEREVNGLEPLEEKTENPITASTVLHRCAYSKCFRIETSPKQFNVCAACIELDRFAPRYCSKLCQSLAWPSHEATCLCTKKIDI